MKIVKKLFEKVKKNGLLSTFIWVIKRLKYLLKNNILCITEFGLLFWIKKIIYLKQKNYDLYLKLIYENLESEVENVIEYYRNSEKKIRESIIYKEGKKKIWVCWWQGYDSMPEFCKMCYKQLNYILDKKKFEIILICEDNYKKYVNIPEYIIDKVKKGNISLTQFSDILREGLIAQNGGVWVDATMWFEKDANNFFSIDRDFWSVKLADIDDINMCGQIISECMWSGFIISGNKNSYVCSFVYDAMCEYFKKHNYVIDYFIQNLLIRIAYNNLNKARNIIDAIEISNPKLYDMFREMNCVYSDELWNNLTAETSIFKLTHKCSYTRKVNGKDTLYAVINNRVGQINDVIMNGKSE